MKDLAKTVLAAKLVVDEYMSVGTAAKAELLAAFEESGIERVRVNAADEDRTDLGTVIRGKGKTTVAVDDEALFVAWVADRYPHEIVQTVNPVFRASLLARMTKAGDRVDTSTGELVPGVRVREGAPYITVRPSDEARDRMAQVLSEQGLPEIGGRE